MKIALIGYGKMGHAIERIALERGHEVVARIEDTNRSEMDGPSFSSADVAIEFSQPSAALSNYRKCLEHRIPIVSGTTGWTEQRASFEEEVRKCSGTFFYASNFSVGVYLFNTISQQLAKLMDHYPNYEVSMDETHHIHKKDHPSGTAITIAEGILSNLSRKEHFSATLDGEETKVAETDLLIRCHREGEVPGTHTVIYDSPQDRLTITHEAKGRDGFALGAVLAAEFIQGRQGIFGMDDLMRS